MNIEMIENAVSSKLRRDTVCAFLVIISVITQMFVLCANGWDRTLDYLNLMHVISRLLFVILCVRRVRLNNLAYGIYGMYIVWSIITAPVRGDITLLNSLQQFLLELFFLSLMYYAFSIEHSIKKKVFFALSYILITIYSLLSIAIIYVAVTRTSLSLPLHIDIGITEDFVTVLSLQRNWLADQLCIVFCLCICVILEQQKRFIRAIFGIGAFLIYVAVGTTRSRTSMIATSIAIVMFCVLILLQRLNGKRDKVRVVVSLLVAVTVLPFAYKFYDLSGHIINCANNATKESYVFDSTFNKTGSADYEARDDIEETRKDDTLFVEKRSRKRILSLTERVEIWYSGFVLLINEPHRMLFGSMDYMNRINSYLPSLGVTESKSSMHNAYLEVLMKNGLLGLFLFGSFIILLLVRMIKVFFSKTADLFVKMLTIPMTASLIKSTTESIIVGSQNITNYIFFLVAGMFLAYSYELFPEKCVGKKNKSAEEASL